MSSNAPTRSLLLVVASPIEANAVLAGVSRNPPDAVPLMWNPTAVRDDVDVVLTGIGKTNAAAATALALRQNSYRVVVSLGIAGAYAGAGLSLGDSVVASASAYADEGILTPDAFQTCSEMGFPLGPFPGNAVAGDPALRAAIAPFVTCAGVIATVSTCSGTDVLAEQVRTRTCAIAECMEGAAIGHVCAAYGARPNASSCPRFGEVRVISNTTGDRPRQLWDMKRALSALTAISRDVVDAGFSVLLA